MKEFRVLELSDRCQFKAVLEGVKEVLDLDVVLLDDYNTLLIENIAETKVEAVTYMFTASEYLAEMHDLPEMYIMAMCQNEDGKFQVFMHSTNLERPVHEEGAVNVDSHNIAVIGAVECIDTVPELHKMEVDKQGRLTFTQFFLN